MKNTDKSFVEETVLKNMNVSTQSTRIKYLTVDNFPKLGLVTALRFLEWAAANPEGVISLPTGKTPEYFIKWTLFLLDNWNTEKGQTIRKEYGLQDVTKPDLSNLHFVQIDEFYPINPAQHNSFYHYVNEFT